MSGIQQSVRSTAEAGLLFSWSQQRKIYSFGWRPAGCLRTYRRWNWWPWRSHSWTWWLLCLVASRGTAIAFLKSGCEHGKVVNRPNFSLSPADLDNIPNLARSIANRFIKLVWTKGGRSKAGDEARSHLKPVIKLYLVPTSSFKLKFCLPYFDSYKMTKLKPKLRSKERKLHGYWRSLNSL